MSSSWICFLPIILFLIISAVRKRETEKCITARINRKEGNREMEELAKKLIGQDVLLNTVSMGTVDGILKDVTNNAAVIEKDGKESIVNLDFVIRLREYPKGKNGKRKSFVID